MENFANILRNVFTFAMLRHNEYAVRNTLQISDSIGFSSIFRRFTDNEADCHERVCIFCTLHNHVHNVSFFIIRQSGYYKNHIGMFQTGISLRLFGDNTMYLSFPIRKCFRGFIDNDEI